MSSDVLKMIRRVSLYDISIGILLMIPVYIMFTNLVFSLLVGIAVAIVNFGISSIITDLLLNKKEGRYMPLYLVSFIVRIAIISLIGFVLFTQNKYNVIAFVGGYTTNLLGVSLYSMTKK